MSDTRIEKLSLLVNDIERLNTGDNAKLNILINRAELLIRKTFGEDSHYLKKLQNILFTPRYSIYITGVAGSIAEKRLEDIAFKNGVEEFKGLVATIIDDLELDMDKNFNLSRIKNNEEFIHTSRIEQLKSINHSSFDFSKLIQLCHEINSNFENQNYFSVALLSRALIDHIPPIFGFNNFSTFISQHGSQSFKGSMQSLDKSMRNIADNYLHQTIRKKENLPNSVQIKFHADLDVLLSEIVRVTQ